MGPFQRLTPFQQQVSKPCHEHHAGDADVNQALLDYRETKRAEKMAALVAREDLVKDQLVVSGVPITPWRRSSTAKVVDLALLMSTDDGGERGRQPRLGIDAVEFAGFDQRGEDRPVLGPGVVAGEESVLPVQGNGADGAFDLSLIHI